MAKITSGILGGFSGKIGNIVGASWKGISVMRVKPASVANPRTAPQVNQRNKFGGAVQWSHAILANIIKPLNDRFAVRQSGFNQWVSRNVSKFENDGIRDNNKTLEMSSGELGTTEIDTSGIAGSVVTLTWNTGLTGKQLSTDEAYVVIERPQGEFRFIAGYAAAAVRSAGTVEVTMPNGSTQYHYAYLMFRSADGTKVSNTAVHEES